MRRIRLDIEYDGTNYAGWQRQLNALSVQEAIEDNIYAVTGERVSLVGAGRTDSGVHARHQVAHFDTASRMPADRFCYALNTGLPRDIRVFASSEVGEDFHARFSAVRKHYRYVINNAPHASAIDGRFQHHIHGVLDADAMREAAGAVAGEHDFAAFMAQGGQTKTTVREIYRSEVTQRGSLIAYDVEGNGFLYNMVRILVGTLIEVGFGKRPVSALSDAMRSGARESAGPTAPAQGLTLMEVWY